METLQKTFLLTLRFLRSDKTWSFLAALQLFFVIVTATILWLPNPKHFVFWVLGFLAYANLMVITFFFWNRVYNKYQEHGLLETRRLNLVACMRGVVASFIVLLVLVGIKHSNFNWSMLVIISSVIMVTSVFWLLFLWVLQTKLLPSLGLTIDLWSKKSSIPGVASLLFILANSLTFSVGRVGFLSQSLGQGFSGPKSFVTICLLVILMFVLCSIFLAWFNLFLVLGFLEMIKTGRAENKENITVPEENPNPTIITGS